MKEDLELKLSQIVKDLYKLDKKVELTIPPSKDLGDFSTNIALVLAKQVGKSPKEIAEEILQNIKNDKSINRTEIAGPGFMNLFINHSNYFDNLLLIVDSYGTFKSENSKKIMVEFGHPNTHKLPHIGHLYSYIVGSSLSNILRANGNEIIGANYQGDIGPHVAKCIYGWIQKGKPVPETLTAKVKLLQECYQEGSALYELEEHKEKISQINKDIYNPDSEIQKDWKETRQWSIDYYKNFEEFLGINQKFHYFESDVWKVGLEKVKENIGKVFEESQGAVIFPGEKYGLHSRVFITQNSTPTYEAKEVGLVMKKMHDVDFDLNITPTAREQNGYFEVVIKAMQDIFPELENKLQHIGFGMVSLSTGKMSSRSGKILSATELLELIIEKIGVIMQSREGLDEKTREENTKKIALGAVRYAFFKSNILKDMKFDIEESISFDGNSGPYLQYTYARIQSVLRNTDNIISTKLDAMKLSELCNSEEELDLVKYLNSYPDVVQTSGKTYSPHLIATYLFELSQIFGTFYNKQSINSAESQELITARRIIAEKTAIVIKNGLNLLGIDVVDKM